MCFARFVLNGKMVFKHRRILTNTWQPSGAMEIWGISCTVSVVEQVVQCLTENNLVVKGAQISSLGGWFVDGENHACSCYDAVYTPCVNGCTKAEA